jgi:hypothetical protein
MAAELIEYSSMATGMRAVWLIAVLVYAAAWLSWRRAKAPGSPAGCERDVESCPRICRPRRPRETPLFQLLESLYESVKLVWDERFEQRYGFWQGCWDSAVGPLPRLRDLGAGLRPRSLWRVPLRDARPFLLQTARAVPLVRRKARL